MSKSRRGRIGPLLLALVVAGGIAYGFMPRPLRVELVRAHKGSLAVTVDEEGKTRVRERYVVAAPVAGQARRITLKVGNAVAAGQVVAWIDPLAAASLDPRARAQAQARVEAARASLQGAGENARVALAEAVLARQELDRVESLARERFVSQAAVDQAKARLQAGQATRQAAEYAVQAARHEVEAARAALLQVSSLARGGPAETLRISAPVAGQVLAVPHESEGAVQPGQVLLEIGNPQSLEVVVEVLSTAAVKIIPGGRVLLDRWGGPQPLEGRVRMVEPAGFTKVSALGVEEQRVRVIVDITTPPEVWSSLGDGYRVEASFVLWQDEGLLLIPTSALFRHKDGWAVFVVRDGRARLTPLEVGQRNGLAAQVLEGLKAGAAVIAHPDEKVMDGVKVQARGP
ncbi:MAG TPA: efflux RND transporter periplasmic adaptor subunit [Thiobacillaceae bacterium]|nr:efflux RND transporter periplasmic adaptor subunit [Thiobacillaceae bacterium]HNU63106.1 efflux RND transporter periplasmic adaptor subunit [Thiobacillaceae bacterium]